MKLTQDDIKRACQLSRIALTQDECAKAQNELGAIFDWMDRLDALDVSGVDLHDKDEISHMTLHQDEVDSKNYVDDVLLNAPKASHNMFVVPKVIE